MGSSSSLVPVAAIITAALLISCGGPGEGGAMFETGEFKARINGMQLHFAVYGRGPALMILPNSWGITYPGLRGLLGGLEKYFTLIYFNPRGMGESAPPEDPSEMSMKTVRQDLEGLRRALNLGRVSVLGWSNGGTNLIIYAAEYPESVDRVVILHAAAHLSEEDMAELERDHPEPIAALAGFEKEMSGTEVSAEQKNQRMKEFALDRWFPHLFANPADSRPHLQEVFGDASFSYRHYFYANSENFDVRRFLPRISSPALVMAGKHDVLPVGRVREVHEGITDSRFVLFSESGHFAPVEEPERFVQVVREFLISLRG